MISELKLTFQFGSFQELLTDAAAWKHHSVGPQ